MGTPLHVNSGYRCPELNKAVGGVKNSNHIYGYAADITTGYVTKNRELMKKFLSLDLPFTGAIQENNGRRLHLSYNPDKLSRKIIYR